MTDSYKEKRVDLDGRGIKKKLGERGNHNQNILNEGKKLFPIKGKIIAIPI